MAPIPVTAMPSRKSRRVIGLCIPRSRSFTITVGYRQGTAPPIGVARPQTRALQMRYRSVLFAILATAVILGLASLANAGTTGQFRGRVVDSASKAPLAGVKVSL